MGGYDKGMELGTSEITPVHEPSPKAAAAHTCRQLVAPACGSVLLGALQEAGEWLGLGCWRFRQIQRSAADFE